MRADLQVRPEAFLDDLSAPTAASEHPKQVGSMGCKKLVGGPGGIAALNRAITNAENAIDQHPAAHNIFQTETAVSTRTHNEDIESGRCKAARGGRDIQE